MGRNDIRPTTLGGGFDRRTLLRGAGAAVGLAAMAPLLQACSVETDRPFDADPDGVVHVANWPLYLDRVKRGDGTVVRPSLERFTEETGILVNYREVIPDAESFYQLIQPYLSSGRPTGWDVVVITNGLTMTKMIGQGYVQPLPPEQRPAFDANVAEAFTDPAYDPGARFTMPWQSGITGIAYNPALTGRQITSLRDLFSPEFAGKVGMFGDAVDMPNLTMVALGIDPETSTPDDWRAAADLLRRQRDEGIVGRTLAQNYVHALANGDVAVSMAWSGDIFQQNQRGASEGLQFAIPDEGAILWTDAMMVPEGAEHPADAMRFMDFVFRPEIAAMIAAWVNYVTPVPGARDELLRMAAEDPDPEAAELARLAAESQLVFPDEETLSQLSTYRELRNDAEIAEWEQVFGEFYL
jgi:spermidine/putrescine transport system substrate-binding protein